MILSILVVVVLGVFIYFALYNKPHINVSKSSADISLTSKTIIQDFESNETIANSKYLEQIIEVTGAISDISLTKDKGIIVLGEPSSFGSVMCHLSAEENQKINTFKKGQQITIKGICTGYLMDVILVKCIIVE